MQERNRDAPVVYVTSAYSGDVQTNVERTKAYSDFVIKKSAHPLNPILNLHGVLSEETDRDLALEIDLHLLQRCADEVWVFGTPTSGMSREIEIARAIGMPIRWFNTEMEEIGNG